MILIVADKGVIKKGFNWKYVIYIPIKLTFLSKSLLSIFLTSWFNNLSLLVGV